MGDYSDANSVLYIADSIRSAFIFRETPIGVVGRYA
jgi:hypothetical protein